jgi:Zn-dependent protease
MEMLSNLAVGLATWAIPIFIAITFHEAAHGYAAYRLGDNTAKLAGRLSLNPVRHIDPFGTILLPIILLLLGGVIFGYAKPVPVNSNNFKSPRPHMAIVAAAGPLSNLILAVIGGLLIYTAAIFPDFLSNWWVTNLSNFIFINCLLVALNIIPLPPLDGSRIVSGILPDNLARQYNRIEPYGLLILVGVIFVLPMAGRIVGLNLDLARVLVLQPAQTLYDGVLMIVGFGI